MSSRRRVAARSVALGVVVFSALAQVEPAAAVKISSLPHGCVGVTADKMHVLEWFEVAAERGLDGVEIMDNWVKPGLMVRADRELMRRMEKKLAELDLQVSAFINHGPHIWPTAERNRLELDKARFFMDWAQLLGAKIFRVTTCRMGGAQMSDEDARKAFAGMIHELLPYAAKRGLVIALEEHPGFAGTVAKMEHILEKVPNRRFGIAFDSKNTLREGEEPLAVLQNQVVLERLVYTHIDNFRRVPTGGKARGVQRVGDAWWDRSVTLSDGDVDIAALVHGLKQHGYDGWLSVEYGGTNLEHVFESITWLKSVWNKQERKR